MKKAQTLKARILVATPFDDEWTWLSEYFEDQPYEWKFHRADLLSKGRKGLILHAATTAILAKRHDLLITHGPWLTLFTAAFTRLFRVRTPHFAFTFNHGNGLFFTGIFLRLAYFALPTVSRFVTHSTAETQMLAEKYKQPSSNFLFTHWAARCPPRGRRALDYLDFDEPFVCCIGRNNRDLGTFIEAVRNSGVRAVLICRKGQADGYSLPARMTLREDVTMSECDEVLERAAASVVPLLDDSTGAGHMTIVTSLLLGTPVIATRSPLLSDYVRDGETGILVERGSIEELSSAFRVLLGNGDLAAALRKSTAEFSDAYLTEPRAAEFLCKMLAEHFENLSARRSVHPRPTSFG